MIFRRRVRAVVAAAVTAGTLSAMGLVAAPRASADTGSTNQTGFQDAFVRNGTVWTGGCHWPTPPVSFGCGSSSLGAAVAPGTSPSIAAVPGSADVAGSSQVAWQGANNHLWITGPSGPADTGLAMMPGTSPALTVLPPENNQWYPNGGDVAVFQGSDGHPWFYTASDSRRMSASLFMAPGTSPAVIPAPGQGGWQAVWQGADNHLWSTGPQGPRDLGAKMMPGTSPSLAELTNGLFAAAVQAYNSNLQVIVAAISDPVSTVLATTGWPMAPGTSPAITSSPPTSDPNPSDLWEATFNGSDGRLWGLGALISGPVIIPGAPGGLALAPGSSPAVNGIILPSYLGAGAAPGYEMFYQDASGNLRYVVGSAFSTQYLDPASPIGSSDAGTSLSADSFQ